MKKIISKDAVKEFELWSEKIKSEDWHSLDNNLKKQQRQQFIEVEPEQNDIQSEIKQQIECIKDQAYQEGYQAGMALGKERAQQYLQSLEQILQALNDPISGCAEAEKQKLIEIIIAATKQVIHRELQTQPEAISDILKQVLGLLPQLDSLPIVYVHPDDLAVLEQLFQSQNSGASHCQLKVDISLARGECRVLGGNTEFDARIDSRLKNIAQLLSESENEPA